MTVWKRKIKDSSSKKNYLLEGRYSKLNDEEEETNQLLEVYYNKLKDLR